MSLLIVVIVIVMLLFHIKFLFMSSQLTTESKALLGNVEV